MARPGPKLSKNPGKTARYYRSNPEARKKHQETNKKINSTPEKREYRRQHMKIRRNMSNISSQEDVVKKNGKWTKQHRKQNRQDGGAKRR